MIERVDHNLKLLQAPCYLPKDRAFSRCQERRSPLAEGFHFFFVCFERFLSVSFSSSSLEAGHFFL